MTTKQIILYKEISERLPYDTIVSINTYGCNNDEWLSPNILLDKWWKKNTDTIHIRLYLRKMSSMTEQEKHELLNYVLEGEGVEYFSVQEDGSIDSKDGDTLHWIYFSANTIQRYLEWLKINHFDYNGLIEQGLALDVADYNPYKYMTPGFDNEALAEYIHDLKKYQK